MNNEDQPSLFAEHEARIDAKIAATKAARIDKARAKIEKAVSAIHAAYWAVCDAEGEPIDPEELDAPEGVLDDAFEVALRVAEYAAEKEITWADARDFF